MKLLRFFSLATVVAFVFSLSLFANIGLTRADQMDDSDQRPLAKNPAAKKVDQEALKKLQTMSPELVKALDDQLAEALTLFYDRKYGKALPIFRAISEMVETMDVMFWLGSCAYKAGESELAIKKFKKMLDIDPNLHRVRLELAAVYFSLTKYDLARQELQTVLNANPPELVKKNILNLLAAIEKKTKKLYANLRFSQGIQKDTNVSVGPDEDRIGVPVGGTITLTKTQKEVDDWVTVSNLIGNVLYDMGEQKGYMWNTEGSFYNTHNFEHHKFDFLNYRIATGPWYVSRLSVLKLPVGYSQNVYEHENLFRSVDFNPSYEYFFCKYFSLKGRFYAAELWYDDNNKEGQDADTTTWELNPNFYFNDRNDIISLFASYEIHDAQEDRYTFDGINFAISYFKHFPWDMEFYARYKYSEREYDTPPPLWVDDREDEKHNVYAALSQNLWKHYFVSVYFNWMENDSNSDLYDYDKTIYGFSAGFKF